MSKSRLRRTSVLASIALGLALSSAAGAQAANSPGTGDTGFFTFRPSAVAGTQINVASGNALVRTRDLADSDGNYHVVVDRAYNSLASDAFSILSPRWGFDVGPATKLAVQNNGDALVTGPSGYRLLFVKQANGTFNAPAGFDGSLVASSSGWTLSRTSQGDQFGFNGSGQLAWTKDSQARDFTVQGTSAAGRDVLSSYGTNLGRRVNLSYSGDSLVREMDDPSSGHHYYGYTNGKLTSYRSPSGAETTYHYGTNGYLDKITEAGGTTAALTTSSAGKVQSITTTLPGAVGQTTSFVYTRRPYKTDVTGPDGVRRTYAFDDDWRVTRQYNPDVKPTVTASGELRDFADQYVGPNRAYALSVAAAEPDGAGLRRLGVERTSGDEIAGSDIACVATPFDLVCPTSDSSSLSVSFANVPEGEQSIRGAAADDEGHRAFSDSWHVRVDRTPPTAASRIELKYFDSADPGKTATIGWLAGEDPELPGAVPGSGEAEASVRYRTNGGQWSPWSTTNADSVDVSGVNTGDTIDVEVRDSDAVGNVAPTASQSIVLSDQLEDPGVQEDAAEAYVDDYGGSLAEAKAWMETQDLVNDPQRGDLDRDISDVTPHAFGGTWFNNEARKYTVNVVAGASHAGVMAVLQARGLASRSVIKEVTYTQGQLEQAQPSISDALDDLVEAGKATVSRRTSENAVHVTLASSATQSEKAHVATVKDDAPVRVVVESVEEESLAGTPTRCSWPDCDPPLRGGIRVYPNGDRLTSYCTNAFLARSNSSGALFQMTAGHCTSPTLDAGRYYRGDPDINKVFPFGNASTSIYGRQGDVGLIRLDDDITSNVLGSIFITKSKTVGSVQTTRNTNYRIRGAAANKEGNYLCMAGATSAARCGKISDTSYDHKTAALGPLKGVKIRGAGLVRLCASPGDSGAPLVKGGLAFGIVSTRKEDIRDRCTGAVYTGALTAQAVTNTTIGQP